MFEENNINNFFSVLSEKKKSFQENYKYFAPRIAPKFNSFNYLRPNENGLSEIIADLLNPKGLHEQGTVFLYEFLNLIERTDIFNYFQDYDFKIICESVTDLMEASLRRIDIELAFGQRFGIAIENKPHACEQENQLSHYADQMKRKYGNTDWLLIFLLGYEGKPTSIDKNKLKDLSQNNNFLQIDYSVIIEWLNVCKEKCKSDKIRYFINDFIEHCKLRFLGIADMSDNFSFEETILNNKNFFEISLEIQNTVPQLQNKIYDNYSKIILSKLQSVDDGWCSNISEHMSFHGRGKPNGLFYKKPHWAGFSFGIEPWSDRFDWGIRKDVNDKKNIFSKGLVNIIRDKMPELSMGNETWPMYGTIKDKRFNAASNEFWLNLQFSDEDMAGVIVEKFIKLDELISNNYELLK